MNSQTATKSIGLSFKLALALALAVITTHVSSQPAQPAMPNLLAPLTSGINAKPTGPLTKVGGVLASLYGEYSAYLQNGGPQVLGAFKPSAPMVKLVGNSVAIDAVAADDPKVLLQDLEKLGLERGVIFGRMVSGFLPISKIEEMAKLPSLQFARAALMKTSAGSVTSQGDHAMRADLARNLFGVDGEGVRVGVLSDSYNCRGGAEDGRRSGDLPPDVIVLKEGDCSFSIDEGRAMMEIIHDVAPGASGAFHTAQGGAAGFAQGIVDLQEKAGAKVIVDDVLYLGEPMFQDGIIAQAVDKVKERGVAYFSSAGNADRQSYASTYRPSGAVLGGGVLHDFDPSSKVNAFQKITLYKGLSIVALQWNEPYFSVSGAPGSASDYDVWLCAAARASEDYCAVAAGDSNVGADPIELFGFNYDGRYGPLSLYLAISKVAGPANNYLQYVSFFSSLKIGTFASKSGTLFGHANAEGAEAVGAAYYLNTPEFGKSPPVLEPFSAAGGIPIWFDTTGARYATPILRQKPEIVAPDGVDTTFFGEDTSDPGTFPNFFGTSAAAPHAAGVAALLFHFKGLQQTPEQIFGELERTAIDMKTAGFDFDSGFGLVQADVALNGGIPVTFKPQATDPNEAVKTVTISVERDSAVGSRRSVSVTVSTRDGTAKAGQDYVAKKQTLTWKAGDTKPKSFAVSINNDTLNEPNETFEIDCSNPTGGAVCPPAAMVTIVDNDPAGTLQFSADSYSIRENDGKQVAVMVTRTGGTASGVTVDVATSDGSAVAGSDYRPVPLTKLAFKAGESKKLLYAGIIDDCDDEADEAFKITLSNPTGGADLGAPDTASVTIADNDNGGTIQFSAANYRVAESAKKVAIKVNRIVPKTEQAACKVSVDVATSDGSAVAGSDYGPVPPTTLTFKAGESTKLWYVDVTDDCFDESEETFNLSLSNPTDGGVLGKPDTASVTIVDNDNGGTIQFSAASYKVGESAKKATIRVNRTVPKTERAACNVSVDYCTANGSAVSPEDYTTACGTLPLTKTTDVSASFDVPVVDDTLDEPNETVDLSLSHPTGGGSVGVRKAAVLTILDNDTAK